MGPLRSIKTLIVNPGHYFRYQSHEAKKIYWNLSRIIKPGDTAARRKAVESLEPQGFLRTIDPNQGASFQSSDAVLKRTERVVDECWNLIRTTDQLQVKNKSYLRALLTKDQLGPESEVMRLALDDDLLAVVSEYLGVFPILMYVNIWFSPGSSAPENEWTGSQLFHMDHEDFKQMKVFLYLNDISLEHGPTHYVSAEESRKVAVKLNYKTTKDEKSIADTNFADSKINIHTGAKGSLLMLDTSNCFHCGGRAAKDRYLLTFQYLTPWSFVRKTYRDRRLVHLLKSDEMRASAKRLLV